MLINLKMLLKSTDIGRYQNIKNDLIKILNRNQNRSLKQF